jgi:hypothetical protein
MIKNNKNYDYKNVGYMIAKEHKNQCFANSKKFVMLFFCMLAKQIFGHFLGFFERGIDFFDPYSKQFAVQKILGLLEMVNYVLCPNKKKPSALLESAIHY